MTSICERCGKEVSDVFHTCNPKNEQVTNSDTKNKDLVSKREENETKNSGSETDTNKGKDEIKGLPTAAYEAEAKLGVNAVQKYESDHPIPEYNSDEIYELVRREDVLEILDEVFELDAQADYKTLHERLQELREEVKYSDA